MRLKLTKKLLSISLALFILLSCGLTNINADENSQAGTILARDHNINLRFYNYQGPISLTDDSKKNTGYIPITREYIFFRLQYLAFDDEGYLIPFEDIEIDQDQLNVINADIEKGLSLFIDNGKTNRGDALLYPITLTTPQGRKITKTVELNIGGDNVTVIALNMSLRAEDVRYDIDNGPLTWTDLGKLTRFEVYNNHTSWELFTDSSDVYSKANVIEAHLSELNEQINRGETGDVKIKFMRPFPYGGHTIGKFTVTLFKTRFKVTYTDGVEGEEVFADQVYQDLAVNSSTPTFQGTPARDGYTFEGWLPQVSATVTEDATYVAQWKKTVEPVKEYTVRYTDGVEGEEVFADQVYPNLVENSSTPVFEGTPTREGYTFEGWLPQVSATVTKDATYVAQWKKTVEPTIPEKPIDPATPTLPKTGVSENHFKFLTVALGGLLLSLGKVSNKKKKLNKQ